MKKTAINKFMELDNHPKILNVLQKDDITVKEVAERYNIKRHRAATMLDELAATGKFVEVKVYNPSTGRYCRAWRKT